ncbi:MAG: hypothetical protein HY698_12720 [Deltaproteobacteria bacterium]|nr:hypothetical protein [Deltaproteobacteria bacterium]
MNTLVLLPTVLLMQAQDALPATQPALPGSAEEEELARALAEDQAARQAAAGTPQAMPQMSSAALLNPEISVIGTFAGTFRRKDVAPSFTAGDDPGREGFTAQELELTFAADVDPYFQMRTFLTIPNQEGIEVEEAYLVSTSLPLNLLFKAGAFRSAVGRNNEQHLHMQEMATRPRTTALLGDDGLRAPGVQLSALLPLPFFATLYGELLSLSDDLSFVVGTEGFFELSSRWSLAMGAHGALLAPGAEEEEGDPLPAQPPDKYLVGGDVYLKWRPENVSASYRWFSLTAEYLASKNKDADDWDGATYLQGVMQVARRVRLAARVDLVGFPHAELRREVVAAASLAFLATEFSRVRLTVEHSHDLDDESRRNQALFLQLEGTIGAHLAHPF